MSSGPKTPTKKTDTPAVRANSIIEATRHKNCLLEIENLKNKSTALYLNALSVWHEDSWQIVNKKNRISEIKAKLKYANANIKLLEFLLNAKTEKQ